MDYIPKSYGRVALLAYEKIKAKKDKLLKEEDIVFIWKESCREEGLTQSGIDKVCPRGTFIGILKELDLNIQWENKKNKNSNYAKIGINILNKNKGKSYTCQELWREILDNLKIEKKL